MESVSATVIRKKCSTSLCVESERTPLGRRGHIRASCLHATQELLPRKTVRPHQTLAILPHELLHDTSELTPFLRIPGEFLIPNLKTVLCKFLDRSSRFASQAFRCSAREATFLVKAASRFSCSLARRTSTASSLPLCCLVCSGCESFHSLSLSCVFSSFSKKADSNLS